MDLDWIAIYGSEELSWAMALNINCLEPYLKERIALEYPEWKLSKNTWKIRDYRGLDCMPLNKKCLDFCTKHQDLEFFYEKTKDAGLYKDYHFVAYLPEWATNDMCGYCMESTIREYNKRVLGQLVFVPIGLALFVVINLLSPSLFAAVLGVLWLFNCISLFITFYPKS